jgi:hypothetical protein
MEQVHTKLRSRQMNSALQRLLTVAAFTALSTAQAATPIATATPVVTTTPVVTEIPAQRDAPQLEGHPLTAVVVTQCNLIVAVYMTMADGRLLRFDQSNSEQISSDKLLTMAYGATRSERIEVSCNDEGAVGFEKHDPV